MAAQNSERAQMYRGTKENLVFGARDLAPIEVIYGLAGYMNSHQAPVHRVFMHRHDQQLPVCQWVCLCPPELASASIQQVMGMHMSMYTLHARGTAASRRTSLTVAQTDSLPRPVLQALEPRSCRRAS